MRRVTTSLCNYTAKPLVLHMAFVCHRVEFLRIILLTNSRTVRADLSASSADTKPCPVRPEPCFFPAFGSVLVFAHS